jgi:hypothetical protein
MEDSKDLEVQFMIESTNKQNKIETTTPNYKLNVNNKVKLIEPNKALKKTRNDISPYDYTIIDIPVKSITISDADGMLKQLLNLRLFMLIQLQLKKSNQYDVMYLGDQLLRC